MGADAATIRLVGVSKHFADQVALDKVSWETRAGEIHALAGMNGSGKSTLVKVLAGVHQPNAGEVRVDGEVISNLTPQVSHELGFRFIHQNPALFPQQTVTDNISTGARFRHSHTLRLRECDERRAAVEAMSHLGITHIDPRARMSSLSQTERTLVAVTRAVQDMWAGITIRLLVMDEPTASLPEFEANRVLEVVRTVAAQGIPVLYISHDLSTLVHLATTVTVLRDGKRIVTRETAGLTEAVLANHMAGAELAATERPAKAPREGRTVLECARLEGGRVEGISFDVREGEVLGIAGLLGSGRSTALRLVGGAQERTSGEVRVNGRVVAPGTPKKAVEAGVALVPEDRHLHAGFGSMTMSDNLMAGSLAEATKRGRISRSAERRIVSTAMEDFDVRPRVPSKRFGLFSGGNQQKAVVARWARLDPKVLLLDEPTQGVDVHARVQIHRAVHRIANAGTAIVVVSSDFSELLQLCDRILVVRQGKIKSEVEAQTTSEEELLHLAGTS